MDPVDSETTQFAPSDRLIEMFTTGARAHYERAQRSTDEDLRDLCAAPINEVLDLDPAHVRTVIGDTLTGVLVSLGSRHQAGILKEAVVAGDSFTKRAEGEILETLPFDHDAGHEFCQMLLSELKSHLKEGWKIAGSWGYVELTNASEVAVVTKPTPRGPRTPYPRTAPKTINF